VHHDTERYSENHADITLRVLSPLPQKQAIPFSTTDHFR
jgi:hypothetical protein